MCHHSANRLWYKDSLSKILLVQINEAYSKEKIVSAYIERTQGLLLLLIYWTNIGGYAWVAHLDKFDRCGHKLD